MEAAAAVDPATRGERPRRRGDKLNARQLAFVANYLRNGGNATQAAIGAGYSPRSATDTGSTLLRHPDVVRELARARGEAVDRVDASAERIILEAARVAFLDPAHLFDEAGELLPIHRIPPDARRAIASIEVEQRRDQAGRIVTSRKVRLLPKVEALRLLAQVRGLLVERVQHEGPATVTVQIGIASPSVVTQAPAVQARDATITLGERAESTTGDVHGVDVPAAPAAPEAGDAGQLGGRS